MRANRYRTLRFCAYALLLLLIFLIQNSRGTAVQLWRATANAVPFFLACLALFEGPYVAGTFGFFSGLLLSIHTTTVEGLTALYFCLFGIAFGLLGTYYMRTLLPSTLIGGSVCILLQGIVRYIFFYALVYKMDLMIALKALGTEWLLSLISGVPVFFIIQAIYRRFQENKQ